MFTPGSTPQKNLSPSPGDKKRRGPVPASPTSQLSRGFSRVNSVGEEVPLTRNFSKMPAQSDDMTDNDLEKFSRNTSALVFEKSLTPLETSVYRQHLDIVSHSSRTNPVPLLHLSLWLLQRGLGVEAIAVLNIVLDIFNTEDRRIGYFNLKLALGLRIELLSQCFLIT
jgi:hypothetical protein